jgi:hypothetical protein
MTRHSARLVPRARRQDLREFAGIAASAAVDDRRQRGALSTIVDSDRGLSTTVDDPEATWIMRDPPEGRWTRGKAVEERV